MQESLELPVGDVTITLGDLLSNIKDQSIVSFDHDSILRQVTNSADVDFPLYIQ